jgi:hypothetical protein
VIIITIDGVDYAFKDDELNTAEQLAIFFLQKQDKNKAEF